MLTEVKYSSELTVGVLEGAELAAAEAEQKRSSLIGEVITDCS